MRARLTFLSVAFITGYEISPANCNQGFSPSHALATAPALLAHVTQNAPCLCYQPINAELEAPGPLRYLRRRISRNTRLPRPTSAIVPGSGTGTAYNPIGLEDGL